MGGAGNEIDPIYGACGSCGLRPTSTPRPTPRPTPKPGDTPVPTEPPSACPKPQLSSAGCSWAASWNGMGIGSVENPVPEVQRLPFPRGLVSIPNKLSITSNCTGPTGGGGVERDIDDGPYLTCDSQDIYGYRSALSWACAAPGDFGATWTMDERAWNVGHTNEGGETIADVMSGNTIQHTYETSSYDKPENGPGVSPGHTQPSYQVNLKTTWMLSANFQRKILVSHSGCWKSPDGENPVSPCYTAWECDHEYSGTSQCTDTQYREYTSLDWVNAESYVLSPIPIYGASVPQDTESPGGCNAPIPIPMLQSQTVLSKP